MASACGETSATAPSGRPGKRASSAASGRGGAQRKPSGPTWRSRQSGVGALELADGEGVEELVGDEEERAGRQVLEPVGPARPPGRAAACAARSAGLVSTSQSSAASRKPGWRPAARRASRISVPRPGPSSARMKGPGPPLVGPGLREPEADELAEHLADLGGGGEVAGRPEGIAGGVVAGEAGRHPGVEAEGGVFEAGRRSAAKGHARRAERMTRTRPAASIGSERSWPMVRPQAPRR